MQNTLCLLAAERKLVETNPLLLNICVKFFIEKAAKTENAEP